MKNLIVFITAMAILTSCGGNKGSKTESGSASNSKISLTAAGATFPLPYYNMEFKKYSDKTGVQMTYGGIGSGGGIRSLTDKVIDFGGTDAFLSDEELTKMPAGVVHIPTCIGAVVIAYNLPGIDGLNLSNQLLEKIFLGEITRWDDAQIKAVNPGVKFPGKEILFIHRSDGSGTTFIFSDYMSKVSPKWAEKVGTGKSLNWTIGMGAKGNPGVAGTIQQTEGAIGYIGSEFAFTQKIQAAKIQNSAGAYILPNIESVSASAKGDIPSDTRIMLTNSSDLQAYPICGFTWLILYKEQAYNGRSAEQAKATIEFLNWLINPEAQADAPIVNYAPLPQLAIEKAKAILRTVTYNGQPILK
jgi:phosphate transport system substrate-binding protein